MAGGAFGGVVAEDGGEEAVGDAPEVEAGNEELAGAVDVLGGFVDGLDVAAMAVDDDEAGEVVAQQAVQHVRQYGAQGGLREGDAHRHGTEIIGAAEGQDGGDDGFGALGGGAFGDFFGDAFGREIVAHRGVRALVLVAAEGQQDDGVAGGHGAGFAAGEFAHAVFGHWSTPCRIVLPILARIAELRN